MPYFERTIGFSTGAVAKGDFRRALDLLNVQQHRSPYSRDRADYSGESRRGNNDFRGNQL
jgi:hypothetical protein